MLRYWKKLTGYFHSLRCMSILGVRCIKIIISSWRSSVNHREFINQITHQGAVNILKVAKVHYHIEYAKSLAMENNAYIFMSNHQSLFDIPLIFATILGTIRPVTKSELFNIPIFGKALHAGECIPVTRHDPLTRAKFLTIAKEKLASGVSVWIFPEGTRSFGQALLPFKSGGFHLARETLAKIVPVGILNTAAVMPKTSLSLSRHQTIAIRVGEPIDVSSYLDRQSELIEKVRHAIEHLLKQ